MPLSGTVSRLSDNYFCIATMFILKTNGCRTAVCFDRITEKIRSLSHDLNHQYVEPLDVARLVIGAIQSGMSTRRLDEISAEIAASMAIKHPDYDRLAARLWMSRLHRETPESFSGATEILNTEGILNDIYYQCVKRHAARLDKAIDHARDFEKYDYFAIKTLERSYLLHCRHKENPPSIIERPQYMLMRVAVAIHGDDVNRAIESYNLMSQGFFTHASPTLFSAGTSGEAFSSCYLLTIVSDSIDGIFETVRRCAMVSKAGGGVGLNISNVRAQGSNIRGTCGISNGIVPMIRVFNNTARYVDQGGGRRPGAFAIYLEPWHADIFAFLKLSSKIGVEEERARDVFLAIWMCDLFMRRVKTDESWSLMCPHVSTGLVDLWGEEFEQAYLKYEAEGKYVRQVPAREVWQAILVAQMETGMPFVLYKDHCNRRSNQQHLGTIRGANLCAEIVEYTSADEVAVCNLASIALPKFVDRMAGRFNFAELRKIVHVIVRNLDRTIDKLNYPLQAAQLSNLRHRPIGIGVQGLADVFALMRLSWTSKEARYLNRNIFATIYRAAIEASCQLAYEQGSPYESYPGSPMSQGLLQPDLWNRWCEESTDDEEAKCKMVNFDNNDNQDGGPSWEVLRAKIGYYGLRNSLLVAPMPTASTAQILGNSESFDPRTSNLYVRRVLAGEFVVYNRYLVDELVEMALWNDEVRERLIADNGSVIMNDYLPADLRDRYRTIWELPQKILLDFAIDRSPYIDQSQSLNLYMDKPDISRLTAMLFYGWKGVMIFIKQEMLCHIPS